MRSTPSPIRSCRRSFKNTALLVAAVTSAAAVVILLLDKARQAYPGIRWVIGGIIISLVFATSVWMLAQLTMPFVAPRFARAQFPFSWIGLITTLLLLTFVGCCMAVGVLVWLGIFPKNNFWRLVISGFSFGVFISLIIGVSKYIYEGMRQRLETTVLALREKDLAEERARKLALEARLSSLESRIHPHFFFNTLNSISSLIREDPEQAERMVERLAALLRFSLESNQHRMVPLKNEIKIVRHYLDIEKVRFGDRLRFLIEIPQQLELIEVPPMSIQTLVENSVKYAVSPRKEGAQIQVSARTDGDRLVVEVSDDGPGFRRDDMAAGHGLDNLQGRLAALFDEAGKIDIISRNRGVDVIVSLPIQHSTIVSV